VAPPHSNWYRSRTAPAGSERFAGSAAPTMTKRAEDFIPSDIQKAAKAAGLDAPLWYVGRSNGHENKKLSGDLGTAVDKQRKAKGLQPAQRIKRTP
jgi:hypothetical protein